jgi:hypothetical protein
VSLRCVAWSKLALAASTCEAAHERVEASGQKARAFKKET